MPSAGFEPAFAAIERPEAYAVHRTATGIGLSTNSHWNVGSSNHHLVKGSLLTDPSPVL
jgi:hypothetical protein